MYNYDSRMQSSSQNKALRSLAFFQVNPISGAFESNSKGIWRAAQNPTLPIDPSNFRWYSVGLIDVNMRCRNCDCKDSKTRPAPEQRFVTLVDHIHPLSGDAWGCHGILEYLSIFSLESGWWCSQQLVYSRALLEYFQVVGR